MGAHRYIDTGLKTFRIIVYQNGIYFTRTVQIILVEDLDNAISTHFMVPVHGHQN